MKPVQYFSDEYLDSCRHMNGASILKYLESFRRLQSPQDKTVGMYIRVKQSLLDSFRARAELEGKRYQTLIKQMMVDRVKGKR